MVVIDREEQHLARGELPQNRMRQLDAIEVAFGPRLHRLAQAPVDALPARKQFLRMECLLLGRELCAYRNEAAGSARAGGKTRAVVGAHDVERPRCAPRGSEADAQQPTRHAKAT